MNISYRKASINDIQPITELSDTFSMTPGVINGALQRKDDTIRMPRVVVKVENIDETIRLALDEGASIFIPRTKTPGLIYCVLHDTEGNEVNIVEEIKKV